MTNRISLAHLPTPIEPLPRLTQFLRGPQLFIKRDDLTGLGLGGNKTRKLEFLVADALAKGSQTLVSTGAVQSNHCRQVAAAAAKLGLECWLVLAGQEPETAQGNLFLDKLSHAHVIYTTKNEQEAAIASLMAKLKAADAHPYLIPYGGSNAIGALGYAAAMRELNTQKFQPDWIVFATSSGGTQAGLMLGAHETGFDGRVLGISVDKTAEVFQPFIASLINEAAAKQGLTWRVEPEQVLINSDYCAAGYGVLQPAEVQAIRLFATLEGVLLDPVYTGRAAAGLIDLIRKGFFKPSDTVLFWHTGGTPALFAEPYTSALAF